MKTFVYSTLFIVGFVAFNLLFEQTQSAPDTECERLHSVLSFYHTTDKLSAQDERDYANIQNQIKQECK